VELPYLAALVVQKFDIQFLAGNDVKLHLQIGLTPEGRIPVRVQGRGG
jgi:hypothetical protein